MKCALATTFILIATAAPTAAEKMNCLSSEYKYEKKLFASDFVFEMSDNEIEWRDFCYSSMYEPEVTTNYPLAVCTSVEQYYFVLARSVDNEPDVEHHFKLLWRKSTDSSDIFQGYDWNRKVPFDVTNTYNYFRNDPQFDEYESISWTSVVNNTHTLNFDIKREQFKYLYESTSIDGLTFEDSSVRAYECE